MIINVPKVPFPNDDICLQISSPGGIAVMLDQHTGTTPWGTDGHLHDTAVIVRSEDSISTGDNMLVVGRDGCEIAIGNNCIAYLERQRESKSPWKQLPHLLRRTGGTGHRRDARRNDRGAVAADQYRYGCIQSKTSPAGRPVTETELAIPMLNSHW